MRPVGVRLTIASVAFAALVPVVLNGGQGAAQTLGEPPPNILVIVTDDQRAHDTMSVMPDTVEYFSDGATFSNAIATTPVCCPSRASIMTGQYAHNHNVRSNAATEAQRLDPNNTVQRYLREAGYRTGLVGKYLNGWDIDQAPPHFDEYAVTRTGYYSTRFGVGSDGGHAVRRIAGYSTDFVKRRAHRFIYRTETNDEQPWLLFVTPFAPHGPSIAPSRYQDAPVPRFQPNPAMLEEDTSDKPPQYSAYSRFFVRREHKARAERQMRSLMPVDDLVRKLTEQLTATEEEDTLVIFMSDNGFMWGEHGLIAKATPYDASLEIPLMMRWDGHVIPTVDERLAANIDIAPTIFEAAGVEPAHEVDGRSLLQPWERESLLAEVYGAISRPDLRWAGVIGRDYRYIEYYGEDETVTTFREYYDMINDPWQLENLFGDGDESNDPDGTTLSTRLAQYRTCPAVVECP